VLNENWQRDLEMSMAREENFGCCMNLAGHGLGLRIEGRWN